MARPERNNIDYFPHPVKHGKKMFFIRKKYGNDGYVVWNMLLEKLGDANFHYLNLNDESELMYLYSEFDVTNEILIAIIEDLIKFGEFDKELWEDRILYNQKFVDSIYDAYKKRSNKCVDKNSLLILLVGKGILKPGKLPRKPDKSNPITPVNPQRIEENRIEEERKENYLFKREFFFNEILEIFYFKNWKNPHLVTETFFNHYEKTGWKDANGREIEDIKAAARNWENKTTQGKNCSDVILNNWQIAFTLIKSKSPDYYILFYVRLIFKQSDKTIIIKGSKETLQKIEDNIILKAIINNELKVAFSENQQYVKEVDESMVPVI